MNADLRISAFIRVNQRLGFVSGFAVEWLRF
jgi:hypothetical protein